MAALREEIARERIAILLGLSASEWERDKGLARKYVGRAIDICKRFRTGLTRAQRLSFCRKCLAPWIPSSTVDIRFDTRNSRAVYSCKLCGHQRAFKYK
jgi:RNase P subunit RPR2